MTRAVAAPKGWIADTTVSCAFRRADKLAVVPRISREDWRIKALCSWDLH